MIRLKCVKENNKLRVRIISPGYSSEANCQFPRDIRKENCEYLVPESDVKFSEMRCKFFYRIGKKNIQIVDPLQTGSSQDFKGLKIYGDETQKECCICLSDNVTDTTMKFVIFAPCGHYCCCVQCAQQVKKCPMCRAMISQLVDKSQLSV
jgi:hypothetical protein